MSDEKRFHARLFWLQSSARAIFQTHRVGVCCRVTVPKRKVEIWGDVSKKRAKYRNVIRCASIWHCPVCANNITAHRRDEVSTVVSVFHEITLPVMISFTISHNSKDSLQTTLGRLCAAWRTMTECRSWAVNSDEYRGYVKSLEITWGKTNGWHPHYHVLFFVEVEACLTDFYNRIKSSWGRAVEANGGSWNSQAMHMTTTDESVAGYIAKWGHEPLEETRERLSNWGHAAELTRGGMKQGKRGSLTPFDMLELFLTDETRRPLWAALLKEYGDTMVGQRQITWSRNPDMRKEAGVKKDLADNEIVEGIDAGYYLLATIEPDEWVAILWAKCQGVILDCAARGDDDMMRAIIVDCQQSHLAHIDEKRIIVYT
jgi:hypothetical protein